MDNRLSKLNILIVDDQDEILDHYHDVLGKTLGHSVQCVSMPGRAERAIRRCLFDIVVIDAKMDYKETALGGLFLAEYASRILGPDAVLVISQYRVKEKLRNFGLDLEFLLKPEGDLLGWMERTLLRKAQKMIERQYGFVAMPFSNTKLNQWYLDKLIPWMSDAGFRVRRMDEIATTKPLTQEIMERIDSAHFVLFLAEADNSNVFYEAGYALAKEKFTVTMAHGFDDLPFDIRGNYTIHLDRSEEQIRDDLVKLMHGLRQPSD
ncbi:MAG: hypothetical protein GWP08_15815 [Nitrospiraceae bacterium]|nr:hypothetical protein [Nitrospiraceae bacterium]